MVARWPSVGIILGIFQFVHDSNARPCTYIESLLFQAVAKVSLEVLRQAVEGVPVEMLELFGIYFPNGKCFPWLSKDFFHLVLDKFPPGLDGGVRGKRVVEVVFSRKVLGSRHLGRKAGSEWQVKRGRRGS